MKLYMKQKVFSWGDKFSICNEFGEPLYYAHGKVFSLGKQLFLCDLNGRELLSIKQKVWTFLHVTFRIFRNEVQVAEVIKKITFFKDYFNVIGPGWEISGNIWAHQYQILQNGTPIAIIAKKWLSWGDTYEIDIDDRVDRELVLAMVLTVDACLAIKAAASNS